MNDEEKQEIKSKRSKRKKRIKERFKYLKKSIIVIIIIFIISFICSLFYYFLFKTEGKINYIKSDNNNIKVIDQIKAKFCQDNRIIIRIGFSYLYNRHLYLYLFVKYSNKCIKGLDIIFISKNFTDSLIVSSNE